MQSLDFQVVLKCLLKTVFSIYIDTGRWCNRNEFGEIRWIAKPLRSASPSVIPKVP